MNAALKKKSQHASPRWGTHKLLAVFPEPPATAAKLRPRTQACPHTGRRRRRQTRVVATACATDPPTEAPAQRQRPRRHSTKRKTNVNPLRRDIGGRTRRSPCFRSHRRPWRNCARAHRQKTQRTRVVGDSVRLTRQRRRKRPLTARDDVHPHWRKEKTKHASPQWWDSRAARNVFVATADRGGTAPTYAGDARKNADTHAGAGVKHE